MTEETPLPAELLEEYAYPTLFGPAEVFVLETEEADGTPGDPVRVLYVGGGFQSATYLGKRRFEPVFEYYRSFDHLFEALPNAQNVLMIGGGAFSYPKHMLTAHEKVSIDVVEIDPAIVEIARKHFYLDELEAAHDAACGGSGRLRTLVQDGCIALEEAPDAAYDVIINDSFDGTNPTGLLMAESALKQAKRALRPEGLYLLNVVVDEDSPSDMVGQAMETLSALFANVYEIPAIDEDFGGADNYLLIASNEIYCFSGVSSMLSQGL